MKKGGLISETGCKTSSRTRQLRIHTHTHTQNKSVSERALTPVFRTLACDQSYTETPGLRSDKNTGRNILIEGGRGRKKGGKSRGREAERELEARPFSFKDKPNFDV